MKSSTVLIGLVLAGSLLSACSSDEPSQIEFFPTTTGEPAVTAELREDSPTATPAETVLTRATAESAAPLPSDTPEATVTPAMDGAGAIVSTAVPANSGEVACSPNTNWPSYTVKRGDTLGRIASSSGVTVEQLLEANCLSNRDLIYAGQPLHVPGPFAEVTPPAAATPSAILTEYSSPRYRVSLSYPADWEPVGDGSVERFEGADGWLELGSLGSPWSLDEVTRNVSQFDLLPPDREPSFERLTLSDGREARIIYPAGGQSESTNVSPTLVAPYAELVEIGGEGHNYFVLKADAGHIGQIARSLSMPPAPNSIGVRYFQADVTDLAEGGKRIVFRWDSFGATRGVIYSGTAERFIPWWPVEASGELTVELAGTIFPDPRMTLQVVNEASQAESNFFINLDWPCAHDYFFAPAPERCPSAAPLVTDGAFQPFERGFMIWLPAQDFIEPTIYVFFDDGRVSLVRDRWSPDLPDEDPDLSPPDGLYQPVRGFGLAWREEPGLRESLGWATAPESNYEVTYQGQARESIPGIYYMRAPDGRILHVVGQTWSELAVN
jgi:LysM repeat protein